MDISTPRSNLVVRFLSVFLLCSNFLYASTDQTGKQKVTVVGNDMTLETVFKQIEKQTGLRFMYAVDALDVREKVTVMFDKVMLDEVLESLLAKKGIEWVYREGVISLKRVLISSTEIDTGARVRNKPRLIVTGRILDAKGEPVLGATLILKGYKKGTKTDADGRFLLYEVEPDATILVSCIGFETRSFLATDKSIVIKMNETTNVLDATIIKGGYYRTTQRNTTGNVISIKSDDIRNQPVSDPLLTLQGRVPGMIVEQTTGVPGGAVKIQIRGQNSIKSGTTPLFVIDGVPYISSITGLPGTNFGAVGNIISTLNFLNPSDIESIDILKDADATAIYGSRGANGVILITTKKGKIGGLKIDLGVTNGYQGVSKRRRQLNTSEYLEMRREALQNDGALPTIQNAPDLLVWDTTRYTDWHEAMIGGTAKYTDAQASISGGSLGMQYIVGGNYHKETTIFPGDFLSQRGGVHFNISGFSPNQRFKAALTGNYTINSSNFPGGDFATNVSLPPNAPPAYNKDGSLNWANSTWMNPYTQLISNVYELKTNNLLTNIDVSYNILPSLFFRCNLGYNEVRNDVFRGTTIAGVNPIYQRDARASALYTNADIKSWIMEPQIDYSKELDAHSLNFLFGATLQGNKSESSLLSASGITQDALIRNRQAATEFFSSGAGSKYKYLAFFGRLGYSFKNKYLANFTLRRDGSSRFGDQKKFANFGSVGVGWIFTEEKGVKNAIPFMNFGKLRASYGTTGNDAIGDYQYLDRYDFQSLPYQDEKGLQVVGIFNPDFAWEVTKKREVGLEMSFFKDLLFLSTSYYSNLSGNQLLEAPLPAIAGSSTLLTNQQARIRNSGIELILTTRNINRKDFDWSTSINITVPRNKLLSYPKNIIITAKEGRSLFVKDLYKFIRVDPETGVYLFEGPDGKAVRARDGANSHAASVDLSPSYYGGIQNAFRYKSIRLDVFFQYVRQRGSKGEFDINSLPGTMRNQPAIVKDRWQNKGDLTNYQRFNQNRQLVNDYAIYLSSDAAYANASFIRCKNISLAWELTDKWLQKMHLSGSRLYIQGQNLFTISQYPGWDPETKSVVVIPPLRAIVMGIQITL